MLGSAFFEKKEVSFSILHANANKIHFQLWWTRYINNNHCWSKFNPLTLSLIKDHCWGSITLWPMHTTSTVKHDMLTTINMLFFLAQILKSGAKSIALVLTWKLFPSYTLWVRISMHFWSSEAYTYKHFSLTQHNLM